MGGSGESEERVWEWEKREGWETCRGKRRDRGRGEGGETWRREGLDSEIPIREIVHIRLQETCKFHLMKEQRSESSWFQINLLEFNLLLWDFWIFSCLDVVPIPLFRGLSMNLSRCLLNVVIGSTSTISSVSAFQAFTTLCVKNLLWHFF